MKAINKPRSMSLAMLAAWGAFYKHVGRNERRLYTKDNKAREVSRRVKQLARGIIHVSA